jgi:hypothetical protein
MSMIYHNGNNKYQAVLELTFDIIKIMLIIEIAPIFYRAVDI